MKFKATKVFFEIWSAINEKIINEKGELVRKYRMFEEVGGSRSSKTWSNFQVIFLYASSHRMKRVVVMRDTASDCRDKVEPEFSQWLKDPNLHIKAFEDGEISVEELDFLLDRDDLSKLFIENKTKHSWTFITTGTTITFTGTDDPDRSIGKSQNVLWVNEPYRFNEEVFKQLTQRTSDFIIVDWNPKQNHFIEDQRKKVDTFCHRSTLMDNPFCPEESRKQVLSYQPISMSEIAYQLSPDPKKPELGASLARAYDIERNPNKYSEKQIKELLRCIQNEYQNSASEYHYKVFMLGEKAERPNRIFKWKKIPRHKYDELQTKEYYGNDWGKVDPWGIVAVKYYDGALYLRELNYASENEIREKLPVGELMKLNAEDDAVAQHEQVSIVSHMYNKLGINKNADIVCDNNRPVKIAYLRRCGWAGAVPAMKPAGSVLDGISLVGELTVYYTDDSPNIEHEQEVYSYKVDKYGVVGEEPEDCDNHLIDPVRYVAQFLRAKGILKLS